MPSEKTPLTNTTTSRSTNNDRKRSVLHAATIVLVAVGAITGLVWIKSSGQANNSATNVVHVRTTNADAPATFPGADDEILNLPGKPATYTSRLFSGYMPISNGGQGFYFLAESQSDTPQTDPVLLWLNGGPGASSLEGCFSENGPLLVNEDGTSLRVNEFGWNKRANMVCIESPIGVGFSYNASGIYKSDDDAQAEDLYWMLQSFLDKFPWLRANDFIITGESYGGIYVPTTAKRIVEGNAEFKDDPSRQIKLTKFAVGNGVNEYLSLSKVEFAYTHALISTDQYMAVAANCPELLTPGTLLPDNHTAECDEAMEAVGEQLNLEQVNLYGVYANCTFDMSATLQPMLDALSAPPRNPPHPIALDTPSCLGGSVVAKYFNQPTVRTAMHTLPQVETWSSALTTGNIDIRDFFPNATEDEIDAIIKNKLLDYTPTHGDVVTPLWTFLLDHDVDGVIYHGDTDLACDFIGGLWAVESLKLPRKQPRATWSVPGQSVFAGFVEDFGRLKYVTVKGSGHMVPMDKPQEAEAMLNAFILN